MIHGRGEERVPAYQEMILFKDAAWPVPFRPGLEYNSPCHGPWNIVHIGMAVPGSHQIYVCGANCNRGVVLTAAEMKTSDRYSTIALSEEDLINGEMEDLITEGVADIIGKLPRKPPLIFLFTVCVHRFMGLDLDYVYDVLRDRFPDIIFVESTMEPISQKDSLTPEQRLRDGMLSALPAVRKQPGLVSIVGSDFVMDEDSEIRKMLSAAGFCVKESPVCRDLPDYLSMGGSSLYIVTYPTALYGAKKLAERLDTPYLYLPQTFDYEEIDDQLAQLASMIHVRIPDGKALRMSCEEALAHAREIIGQTAIAIDASAFPRWLGLARLLISHGFRVVRIFGDLFSPEEREDYEWLAAHAPDLSLCSLIHPAMRVFPRGGKEKVLAIGQKAAYFYQTPYFVNIVQGAGYHGYAGIIRLTELMVEAFREEKDTEDLVTRKGWGCESF